MAYQKTPSPECESISKVKRFTVVCEAFPLEVSKVPRSLQFFKCRSSLNLDMKSKHAMQNDAELGFFVCVVEAFLYQNGYNDIQFF